MRTWRWRTEALGVFSKYAKRHKSLYIFVNNNTNFNFLKILSNYTIWDWLSQKTISRYCPFKALCIMLYTVKIPISADRAKQIKTKAIVNEDPTEALIRELRQGASLIYKRFEPFLQSLLFKFNIPWDRPFSFLLRFDHHSSVTLQRNYLN